MRSLRGAPVIVTFLYTTCEDTCPTQAQQVKGALDELGEDVPAIAIAVDPPRDTRERARAFLAEQRMTGRMDFVLGLARRAAPAVAAPTRCSPSATTSSTRRGSCWSTRAVQRVSFPVDQVTPERLAHDLRLLAKGALSRAREGRLSYLAGRISGSLSLPSWQVGACRRRDRDDVLHESRVRRARDGAPGARERATGPISLAAIAEAEGLPLAYLEHLVARLRRAELVESRRGAHGGYSLARAGRGHHDGRGGRGARGRDRADRVHHRRRRRRARLRARGRARGTSRARPSCSGPACRARSSARSPT